VVQTVTDAWQGVTTAGATAEWKAEQAQAADGSPATTPKPMPVYFADVDAIFSYELGMDAVNFQSELARVLQDAVTQLTLTAYTTGDGSGKPKGFVPNATAPSRTAGAFTAADVTLLQNSLPPRFRVGSTLELLPGYGANQRPTGQRHAFLYFRTGGDPIVTTAIQVIAKS
jgi:HK97 family phage major capsid protein